MGQNIDQGTFSGVLIMANQGNKINRERKKVVAKKDPAIFLLQPPNISGNSLLFSILARRQDQQGFDNSKIAQQWDV